jgi:hypothetical protein
LVDGIKIWENAAKEGSPNGENDNAHNHVEVSRLLHELATALESKNAGDIDRILEGFGVQALDAETKEAIEKISDDVLMTEFDSAAEIVRSLLKG